MRHRPLDHRATSYPPAPASRSQKERWTRVDLRPRGHDPSMAPPISDAVVVDVLRRVDRLLAPLVGRLGRPRSSRGPSARSGGPTGSPSSPPASPRRRDSSAGWPTCSRCRTPWGRPSSRSSSSGWPPSTTSRRRPSGWRCWRASCWAGTCRPTASSRCWTRARGTYREDALGRAGERGRRAHPLAGRPAAQPHRRRARRPPEGPAAPPLPVEPARGGRAGGLRRRARGTAEGGRRGRRGARGRVSG